ncbi:hypothetical protein [Burkholderia gladioli]|uniref:hypothetical protein n=1 Tax=Burkholderia gladioli TaxID=28095 RepID=UPI001F1EBDB3|nr:hypothetical protein [Burkholderia gladioli]
MRADNSLFDSMIVGAVLKGPGGLLEDQSGKKKTSKDLYRLTTFPPLDWKNELYYTIGYLNSSADRVSEILRSINKLLFIERMESSEALAVLLDFARKFGASNYLSYKLAYLRSSFSLSATQLKVVSEIEREIEHRNSVGMHFSALENISSKISLFVVAQRRVSALVGRVNGEFRRSLALSNFIPTPLDLEDLPGFLLRATESSLIDTLYAILTVLNMEEKFSAAQHEVRHRLDIEILHKLDGIVLAAQSGEKRDLITDYYRSQNSDAEDSLNLYRVASAFLERKDLARYRSKVDCVFGARLLSEIITDAEGRSPVFDDKALLLTREKIPVDDLFDVKLDTFSRTYLFLRFVKDKLNVLQLTRRDLKAILETTLGLQALLAEAEIRALYLTSPPEAKSLVTVLALALFKAKSIDPDVDFEFRTDFISHVNAEHGGSILNFIEELLEDSPNVAVYIVQSLDEVTLEKMYTLIGNASQAAQIRCDILRAVGEKLGLIEYIIEADAISTRSKLSKLQLYFDSSRMYVDSVAMRKWLDSNPTVATEQYRSLYPEWNARISALNSEDTDRKILLIELFNEYEYLIDEIAEDAFEQFCLNAEFGIQSYLGRRIRHNTLDGVTTDTVDAVFRSADFSSIMSNPQMRRIATAWMNAYKELVDRLRREQLQFKSSGSWFCATLNLNDDTTRENLRNLSMALRASGGSEFLNDLVIAFCWKQIAPQLEHAARTIRTTVLQEANSLIDKYFPGAFGVIEAQMKQELHDAVNEVFKKVADWFQVPQTGFVSASVSDLCQIIAIELNRQNHMEFSGEAVDHKFTGISVHRIYDCLAALLKNAQKHGEDDGSIIVHVDSERPNLSSVLEYVSIAITSKVPENEFERSKARVQGAIDSIETGVDMVTEGYTGIKKAKFITRVSEGAHTVKCTADEETRKLTLSFSLYAEVAQEASGGVEA